MDELERIYAKSQDLVEREIEGELIIVPPVSVTSFPQPRGTKIEKIGVYFIQNPETAYNYVRIEMGRRDAHWIQLRQE